MGLNSFFTFSFVVPVWVGQICVSWVRPLPFFHGGAEKERARPTQDGDRQVDYYFHYRPWLHQVGGGRWAVGGHTLQQIHHTHVLTTPGGKATLIAVHGNNKNANFGPPSQTLTIA